MTRQAGGADETARRSFGPTLVDEIDGSRREAVLACLAGPAGRRTPLVRPMLALAAIAALAALAMAVTPALLTAQTGAAAAPAATPLVANESGAYARLSPGNQRIARAIFDAQHEQATGRRSLDQIAAMRQGAGWVDVYSGLKREGLVHDRNLGQAVARSSHTGRPALARAERGPAAVAPTAAHQSASLAVASNRAGLHPSPRVSEPTAAEARPAR
jgi:hypothetical protein